MGRKSKPTRIQDCRLLRTDRWAPISRPSRRPERICDASGHSKVRGGSSISYGVSATIGSKALLRSDRGIVFPARDSSFDYLSPRECNLSDLFFGDVPFVIPLNRIGVASRRNLTVGSTDLRISQVTSATVVVIIVNLIACSTNE